MDVLEFNNLQLIFQLEQKHRCQHAQQILKCELLHPKSLGINVVVRYADSAEKKRLIDYCERKCLEYTLCPRNIRVMCDAISIEVKRLKQ